MKIVKFRSFRGDIGRTYHKPPAEMIFSFLSSLHHCAFFAAGGNVADNSFKMPMLICQVIFCLFLHQSR